MSIDFSASLKSERKRLGLTQAQVAAGCGMSRVSISQYESGQNSPSLELLVPLARLGFDIPKLIGLSGGHECNNVKHDREIDVRKHEVAKRLVASLPNLSGLSRDQLNLVMDSYLSVLTELSLIDDEKSPDEEPVN